MRAHAAGVRAVIVEPFVYVRGRDPASAASLLIALALHDKHQFWSDLPPVAVDVFTRALGHQQVTDAYLVRLAERYGGRVVTFDAPLREHARDPHAVTVVDV